MKIERYLSVILIFLGSNSVCQIKGIPYVFPDSVELKLSIQVNRLKKENPNEIIYFYLATESQYVYRISILHGMRSRLDKFESSLLTLSNRYLLIENEQYPVLLDEDYRLSTPSFDKLGTFQHRDGNIGRSLLLFHGYSLYFMTTGSIIRISEY